MHESIVSVTQMIVYYQNVVTLTCQPDDITSEVVVGLLNYTKSK